MGKVDDFRLFLTPEHACSYLPDQQARTLFVSPDSPIDTRLQSNLSRAGFRRSGQYLYRPQCDHCTACVPTRVPVEHFVPRRRQRRALARNADLRLDLVPAKRDDALYRLYSAYIGARHDDGDMYPPSEAQYDSFLLGAWSTTLILRAHLGQDLLAAAVIDVLDDGLSAVYTFFDPAHAQRSLGTFMLLSEIELTRSMNLPYLYLGYWIAGCEKMAYKAEYRPQQHFEYPRWHDADG